MSMMDDRTGVSSALTERIVDANPFSQPPPGYTPAAQATPPPVTFVPACRTVYRKMSDAFQLVVFVVEGTEVHQLLLTTVDTA